jgi:hypothetical protein
MRFEDKLIRGKTILSPDAGDGRNQYNLLHILVGTVLMITLPLAIYFLSGKNVAILYVSQYIACAAVGGFIGYWAGCVPMITLMVIILSSTGKLLYKLFGGQLGSFGSTEFNVRFLAWILFVIVIFGFAYLGAKMKDLRFRKGKGR